MENKNLFKELVDDENNSNSSSDVKLSNMRSSNSKPCIIAIC